VARKGSRRERERLERLERRAREDDREYADLGDGIQRPVVARIEHDADGGFVIQELVIGRHAGQVQDGKTLSMFTFRYPSGAEGVNLYSTLEDAREAARQEAAGADES
jgi:hypothetical protein